MTSIEKRQQLYNLVLEVLKEKNVNIDNRLKADEIKSTLKKERKEEFEKLEINEESFGSMLSKAIYSQENSEIVRSEGTQGYYVFETPKEVQAEINKKEKEEQKKDDEEKKKEKILYPIFENWLRAFGYRALDTSSNRAMGKWGNPDVTGIKFIKDYDINEVEITSIEVKVNGARWPYDIFEAVAHRRFANNVYFSFAVDVNTVSNYTRNTKLSYYCSTYEIGLLILPLHTKVYDNLLKSKLNEKELPEHDNIIEVYPAKYHPIRLEYKREYLESINVPKDHKMYSWGKEPFDD